MNFSDVEFKRICSMTMYKNRKIMLGEMTFTKDFVNDTRGDLYPILNKTEDTEEKVENNLYYVDGIVKRWFCRFFPYATYEITVTEYEDSVGFYFSIPSVSAFVIVENEYVVFGCGDNVQRLKLPDYITGAFTLIVSLRPAAFDVYFKINGEAEYFTTFRSKKFENSYNEKAFTKGYASVIVNGYAVIKSASGYIDNGISQADMRPIRYENGEIMVYDGKIYFTATIRMQEEKFQGVFSWVPGTAEIELTGALFYDSGDGLWCGDVAASVLFDRETKEYLLWVCSFSHGHILGHSRFGGDPRFGVNVIDIELMERTKSSDIKEFAGFEMDEDPDFFYDSEKKKWFMAVCREDPETKKYRYVFFESDKPFEGYKYIGKGLDGAETGGSFVKVKGEQLFLCGNDFNKVSDYRIYSKDGMQNARFDYPDGGFRGWGTLMPINMGSRTRYFWMTFDRHKASDYNWSYGNLYIYEGEI